MIRNSLVFILFAANAAAQGWPPALPTMNFQASGNAAATDPDYQKGLRALDSRRWDQAIAAFKSCADRRDSDSDAALYWKAYAEKHAGLNEQSLITLKALRDEYASSRWLNDAKALNVEIVGQMGGAPDPALQSDEELKLLAINGLMQSDPNQAVPILQKLLQGNASERLKERALFVLTQSSSPDARKILDQMAHDSSNPSLQRKSIRYMGLMGTAEARNELASIYKSTSDVELKREILRSFMQSGSRDFLYDVAKSEQNPELRKDAIRQLAITGGQDEIRKLYETETSVENKKTILNAAFTGGNGAWLEEIARNEKDPALRTAAIKSLGLMGRTHGDVLVSIYNADQNPEVRHAVLNSLFMEQNGKALVDLARAEKDPKWKQEIVQKMSLVHSKEVTDYMLELLK